MSLSCESDVLTPHHAANTQQNVRKYPVRHGLHAGKRQHLSTYPLGVGGQVPTQDEAVQGFALTTTGDMYLSSRHAARTL